MQVSKNFCKNLLLFGVLLLLNFNGSHSAKPQSKVLKADSYLQAASSGLNAIQNNANTNQLKTKLKNSIIITSDATAIPANNDNLRLPRVLLWSSKIVSILRESVDGLRAQLQEMSTSLMNAARPSTSANTVRPSTPANTAGPTTPPTTSARPSENGRRSYF